MATSLFLDDTPVASAKRLPGESEEERDSSGRLWRTVIIGDQEQRIDMQVIRQYLNGATPRRKMPGISWLKRCQHGSSGRSWPSQDLSSGEDMFIIHQSIPGAIYWLRNNLSQHICIVFPMICGKPSGSII